MKAAIVLSGLLAIATPVGAFAEAPQGRKLKAAEITGLISSKRVSFLRYKAIAPDSSLENPRFIMREQPIRVVYFFRTDGSWTSKCTLLSTTGERPCPRTPTDTGVWETRGDTLCLNSIRVRREDAHCHAIYLQTPKRFFTKLVNRMPSSEDGPADIE